MEKQIDWRIILMTFASVVVLFGLLIGALGG